MNDIQKALLGGALSLVVLWGIGIFFSKKRLKKAHEALEAICASNLAAVAARAGPDFSTQAVKETSEIIKGVGEAVKKELNLLAKHKNLFLYEQRVDDIARIANKKLVAHGAPAMTW